jgi:deoxyribonuclease V
LPTVRLEATVCAPARAGACDDQRVQETWPCTEAELIATQDRLAEAAVTAEAWAPAFGGGEVMVGGCFLAYAEGQAGPGGPGDRAWAAAVVWVTGASPNPAPRGRRPDQVLIGSGPGLPRQARDVSEQAVISGPVAAGYQPGLLALREGPLLGAAVASLRRLPAVVLVDATGLDHPRRAGLALHLGAVLGVPTVGVTHRPLVAAGSQPAWLRGATSPLLIAGHVVAMWVCTRTSTRPVVAHAGWRTSPATAAAVVLGCSSEGARIPAPLGEARRVAREARALAEGRINRRVR